MFKVIFRMKEPQRVHYKTMRKNSNKILKLDVLIWIKISSNDGLI